MASRSPSHVALGRAVRQLREARETSQEDLAHAAGIHFTYLSGIERGRRNPTWNVVVALAEALEHRNVAQRGLARAVKAAGLDGHRPPTFHELRHAHASAWIAAGGDLVELSTRLGHRDPAVTASVYSHEFEAAARSSERRARLDAIYGAATDAGAMDPQQPNERVAELRHLSRRSDPAQ